MEYERLDKAKFDITGISSNYIKRVKAAEENIEALLKKQPSWITPQTKDTNTIRTEELKAEKDKIEKELPWALK